MNKQLLWDLFNKTGKIEYYMRYKEVIMRKRKRTLNRGKPIIKYPMFRQNCHFE